MYYMSHERHVLVRAKALDELVQLAEIAAERLDTGDPGMDSLRDAIRGATAEVRTHSLLRACSDLASAACPTAVDVGDGTLSGAVVGPWSSPPGWWLTSTGCCRWRVTPDPTQPYHGQFTGASVFVVARGTDKERLFRKLQADDATRYAMTQGTPGEALTIDHLHSTSLAHQAMVELLGA